MACGSGGETREGESRKTRPRPHAVVRRDTCAHCYSENVDALLPSPLRTGMAFVSPSDGAPMQRGIRRGSATRPSRRKANEQQNARTGCAAWVASPVIAQCRRSARRLGGEIWGPRGFTEPLTAARRGGALKADVGDDVRPDHLFEYFLTPNWGVDRLGRCSSIEVKLNGAHAADVKQLPPDRQRVIPLPAGTAVLAIRRRRRNYTLLFQRQGKGRSPAPD